MTAKKDPDPEDDPQSAIPLPDRVCPFCGLDSNGYRTTGRLGCPLDYDIFAAEVALVFRTSQAASFHVGKWPKRGPSPFEVLKLQSEMRLAIARQDYESAARIRDRLRERNKHRES